MPRDHMPQGAGQRAVRGHQQRQMRNRSEQGLRLDPYIQSIKRTRPPGPHAPISEAAKSPGRAKPGKILYKKQLGVGYWVLGIGYWVLGIRYWVLGIRLDIDYVIPRSDSDEESWRKDFSLPLEMTMRMFFRVTFCKNTAAAE